jgi:hypothetical protein
VKHGGVSVIFCSAVSWYSILLGNQVHSMIKTLFTNNDSVFQDDNPSHSYSWNVQLWFEELQGDFGIFPGQQNHHI